MPIPFLIPLIASASAGAYATNKILEDDNSANRAAANRANKALDVLPSFSNIAKLVILGAGTYFVYSRLKK